MIVDTGNDFNSNIILDIILIAIWHVWKLLKAIERDCKRLQDFEIESESFSLLEKRIG